MNMEDFDPTNVMFMPNGLEKNIRIQACYNR
jgi:hypothetical protein